MTSVEPFRLADIEITPSRRGADTFAKVSYPIRCGRLTEIRTADHVFEFNLNGEIRFIRGLKENWPHRIEWLKRTDGNDWVYYSTGAYNEVISFLGEYYRPCLSYPSNSPWTSDPFRDPAVKGALKAWETLRARLAATAPNGLPPALREPFERIVAATPGALAARAERLHRIVGGRLSVLPPDARHADYQVLPLTVADGCLHHCAFCCVKTHLVFRPRTQNDIRRQLRELKRHFGDDAANYNAVFLAEHDALAAGHRRVAMAAGEAFEQLGLAQAHIKDPALFLFGSADAFLASGEDTLAALNRLPFYTYLNIGLESADDNTLRQIGKPIDAARVREAFLKMLAVNRGFHNLEVSANFLLGDSLPPSHAASLAELLGAGPGASQGKGAAYLSPLRGSQNTKKLLDTFLRIKRTSRLPAFIYLIHRL